MTKKLNWSIVGLLLLIACSEEQVISVFTFSSVFNTSVDGWVGDFADYPESDSIAYELIVKHDTIPTGTSVNSTAKGMLVSGKNSSDDLFMFLKKKISGLQPNRTYSVLFNIKVASNAPTGAVGIGGAPGESVYLKVGATLLEPKKQLDAGMYRMNIDKGNQDEEGSDMINIGHVGVAATTTKYTVITRNNSTNNFTITTDESGEVWLIIGSDSGFEGTTTLYYTQIDVLFNQLGN
jgi:hypothetical protein